jgi:phosphate transport system permease protein
MSTATPTTPAASPERPELNLERNPFAWRNLSGAILTGFVGFCTLFALIPLFSVLYTLLRIGLERFSLAALTTLAPPFGEGFGNAIVGSFYMVGIATLISVPVGMLGGIYLAEFGKANVPASIMRFSARIMTGLPSILAGVFAYIVIVLTFKTPSALAGGLALSLLMLPMIMLTSEEAFTQVPRKVREAAYGLGCTDTQVVLKVVFPMALPSLFTGLMLAIARAAGETAPLLFTASFAGDLWTTPDRLTDNPAASMAVFIYNFATLEPDPEKVKLAWTASLVLVFMVLGLNILAQRISKYTGRHQR